MSFHHGLTSDHGSVIPRELLGYGTDPETGVIDLVGRDTTRRAIARATELLKQYPDGVSEIDLTRRLASDMKILERIAIAAVDSLASSEEGASLIH